MADLGGLVYGDPVLFEMCDVLTEETDIRARFAPRVSNGVVLGSSNVNVSANLDVNTVDVTTAEHFIAAGFEMTFVGTDADTVIVGAAGAGVGEIGRATTSTNFACKLQCAPHTKSCDHARHCWAHVLSAQMPLQARQSPTTFRPRLLPLPMHTCRQDFAKPSPRQKAQRPAGHASEIGS